ncbi:hypothetical protein [Virgibacillus dokdonensis]|uniref:hypothetical protein n=1 Tax=Virgibacillus dokdonensis TaxID=302167 RepID=UPI0011310C92|nr:hypothetical protein [Virgibacillus dokdonensis]
MLDAGAGRSCSVFRYRKASNMLSCLGTEEFRYSYTSYFSFIASGSRTIEMTKSIPCPKAIHPPLTHLGFSLLENGIFSPVFDKEKN